MFGKLCRVAALMCVAVAGPAWADHDGLAEHLPELSATFKPFHCYRIDSRHGWQRVPTGRYDGIAMFVLTRDNAEKQKKIGIRPYDGWSVDARTYPKVGLAGHTGEAARRLEPYAGYKALRSAPFGALLIAAPGLDARPVPTTSVSLPSVKFLDFRINDSAPALGDNDGAVVTCVSHLADGK